MRTAMRIVQALIALLVLALLVGGWWYVPGELRQQPALTGTSEDASVRQGERRRSYVLYVPRKLAEHPALLVVLHGSQGNGERMRRDSGYRFDALADRDGFLLLYPDGFEGHWNDCRRVASYSAASEHRRHRLPLGHDRTPATRARRRPCASLRHRLLQWRADGAAPGR